MKTKSKLDLAMVVGIIVVWGLIGFLLFEQVTG